MMGMFLLTLALSKLITLAEKMFVLFSSFCHISGSKQIKKTNTRLLLTKNSGETSLNFKGLLVNDYLSRHHHIWFAVPDDSCLTVPYNSMTGLCPIADWRFIGYRAIQLEQIHKMIN